MKRWMPYADGMAEEPDGPYVLWVDHAEEVERLASLLTTTTELYVASEQIGAKHAKGKVAAEATAERERERADRAQAFIRSICAALAEWPANTNAVELVRLAGEVERLLPGGEAKEGSHG